MVTKCANPSCAAMFRYFRGGKLFVLASNSRAMMHEGDFREHGCATEYFWLCQECASTMTIISDGSIKPSKDGEEHIPSVWAVCRT